MDARIILAEIKRTEQRQAMFAKFHKGKWYYGKKAVELRIKLYERISKYDVSEQKD